MNPVSTSMTSHSKQERADASEHINVPENWCFHYLFEAQTELTPEATAAIFEGERLTYRQLNDRANQLAYYLQGLGVGLEVPVGICLERSLALPVAYLAVFKAGGACLSLEPAYPNERLAFMLSDTRAPVLLTQTHLQPKLSPHQAQVVCIDTDWPKVAQHHTKSPTSGVTPENLAFINYTSGSTGQPKGVMVSHRARVSRLLKRQELCSLSAADRHLLKSPISSGPLIRELFWPLLTGACLVIARPGGHQDLAYLINLIAVQQITVMNFVPSLFRLFLEQENIEETCRTLNHVFCGGEALPVELQARFLKRLPATNLHQFYGLTEVAVITYLHCNKDKDKPMASIGRPTDLPLYFLDNKLRPAPAGEPGEIYVGGAGLARGYLNRPDLTAERFIPNPFSPNSADRLYRTGDLGRYLPDGRVEFLGRADQQLKIRGFRVELGEIETMLTQHPQVRLAAVLPKTLAEDDIRLVAFVVPTAEQPPATDDLRAWASQKLPASMVPDIYILLDTFPLTPNGKINRQALPMPADLQARPEADWEFVAPRTQIEMELTEIWQSILHISPISIKDNFFELGGHSLLALRLLAQMEKKFKRKISLTHFLQTPTIEQLAHYFNNPETPELTSSLIPLRANGAKPPLFWLPGNMGNVFTDLSYLAQHLDLGQPFYGLQDGLAMPSRVDKLAAHYISEIQTIQPTGPYFLGGICAGGVVAFEMAQQLQRCGQEIGLLALVEPSPPHQPGLKAYLTLAVSILRRLARRSSHHTRNISQLNLVQRGDYTRLRVKAIANRWGLRFYQLKPYPNRLDLFLTTESLKVSNNPQLKWQALSKQNVDLHEIPGSHNTITGNDGTPINEKGMKALAEQVQGRINAVLANQQIG